MGDRGGDSRARSSPRSGGRRKQVHLQSPAGEASPVIHPRPSEVEDRQIGRYQVVGEITRGSKSVVLKSRDTDLGRDVAMKVLKKDLHADALALQRFVEEAQVGAQLQHPGILPVYELGLVSDNRPYFTMKYIRGETLAILLGMRESPKDDQRKYLGIFEKVCHAIAYAHTRNVVHRDLRPWNIMIGDYGDVVVMDWGFAKISATTGEPSMSRSASDTQISIIETIRGSAEEPDLAGMVIGTPGYMSPEQAAGDVDRLDERSDVFALGAILCEILTGAAPYRGDRVAEILDKAQHAEQADALTRLDRCGADRRLVKLAKHCLLPSQQARPRNADEVASALGRILTAQETEARAAQIAAEEEKIRARGATRARRLTFGIAGAVLLVGVLTAGLFLWMDRSDRREAAEATEKVLAALGAASDHRRVAEADPAGGPDRWADALAAANAARNLAASSPVDAAVRERAEALAREVGQAEAADRSGAAQAARRSALIAALTEIRATGWEEPGTGAGPERYAAAFHEYGVDVDGGVPTEVESALSGSDAEEEIVGALDDWNRMLADQGVDPAKNVPLNVVRRLDKDSIRNRIRTVIAGSTARKRRAGLLSFATQLGGDLPFPTEALLGSALLRSGAPEFAEPHLRAAVKLDPRNFWTQFHLASALLNRASPDLTESVGRFSTALALRPDSREARHGLAESLTRKGAYGEAEALWRRLLEDTPGDGHMTAHLGATLLAGPRYDEGRALLENAAAAVADDPWVRNRLGVLLLRRREWTRAAREFAAATQRAPSWRAAHRNWMRALAGTGGLDQALARYQTAADTTGTVEDWLLLGECLTLLGRAPDAIQPLERAINGDPADAEAHFALGVAEVGTGDSKRAIVAFTSAMDHRPGYPAARRRLALTSAEMGNVDGALAMLRAAEARSRDDPEVRVDIGWLLLRTGAESAALDAFERAGALDHGLISAHLGRAFALERLGRYEGAARILRLDQDRRPLPIEAVEQLHSLLRWTGELGAEVRILTQERVRHPEDPDRILIQASALLHAGRLEEALEAASVAAAQAGAPPGVELLRGRALESLGKFSAAAAAYQKAADADPWFAAAWCRLGLVELESGRFHSAVEHLSIGHRLGTNHPAWPYPSREWLADARRMVDLESDLPQVLAGQRRGETPAEQLDLARLLLRKGEPALAARLFRQAWEQGAGTFPEPSDDHAYLGARAVALASFPIAEREEWGELVLAWFGQGLMSAGARYEKGDAGAALELDRWFTDGSLSGFREEAGLNQLSEDLRNRFQKLWDRVKEVSRMPRTAGATGGGR